MARRLPACVLAVAMTLLAGCGDNGSGALQGNGFVEGATQLGGRLPHLEWQPEGGETLVGWSRVFEVTGDPLEVFDALADRLGFGPKVTAARACAVSGEERRLLRDEPRSGEGPLWCEVESGEGRVNLLFPVGRACARNEPATRDCPLVGSAWVDEPLPPVTEAADDDRFPATSSIDPVSISPDDEIHLPRFHSDLVLQWPEPGESNGITIPTGAVALGPGMGIDDCWGVVISTRASLNEVFAFHLGPGLTPFPEQNGRVMGSASDMAQQAIGIEEDGRTTAILKDGCAS